MEIEKTATFIIIVTLLALLTHYKKLLSKIKPD